MDILTFGKKEENRGYIERPAVYGLLFTENKEKIAVIQTENKLYFLPGGGIEQNETHEECLKREAFEEMGMEIKVESFIGEARRYFYSSNEHTYYLSIGYFYIFQMIKQLDVKVEEGHTVIWMDPVLAIDLLFHDHQRWAVKQSLTM